MKRTGGKRNVTYKKGVDVVTSDEVEKTVEAGHCVLGHEL